MFDKPRKWNKQNIKNYVEIYIKSNLNKIIKLKKKKFIIKNIKNLVGIDIIPEFPKRPYIKIINSFNKNKKKISKKIISEIKKKIK